MSLHDPIVLIEDDADDHSFFVEAMKRLGYPHEIIWFKNTYEAKAFLVNADKAPFLIFCDINMPMQNGIEFKQEIDADPQLREKSIPFVFYSTAVRDSDVDMAYTELTVQGFFQKPTNFSLIKDTLKVIIDYWKLCRHPND